MAFNLDAIDRRRIEREHSLHPHASGYFPDGEHLARAASLARNDEALEDLDALFVALFDLHVDLDGVAGLEVGDVRSGLPRLH